MGSEGEGAGVAVGVVSSGADLVRLWPGPLLGLRLPADEEPRTKDPSDVGALRALLCWCIEEMEGVPGPRARNRIGGGGLSLGPDRRQELSGRSLMVIGCD